jgi:hypothetical protein
MTEMAIAIVVLQAQSINIYSDIAVKDVGDDSAVW